jgi:hypothetical protein
MLLVRAHDVERPRGGSDAEWEKRTARRGQVKSSPPADGQRWSADLSESGVNEEDSLVRWRRRGIAPRRRKRRHADGSVLAAFIARPARARPLAMVAGGGGLALAPDSAQRREGRPGSEGRDDQQDHGTEHVDLTCTKGKVWATAGRVEVSTIVAALDESRSSGCEISPAAPEKYPPSVTATPAAAARH